MTELLERALEAVRRQPPDVQDRVAEAMLSWVEGGDEEPMPAADREAVLAGLGQLRRGEYATDEEVAAAFRSFGK